MKEFIEAYIEDHVTAWSPTTIKSERSRLRAVAHKLEAGPAELYQYLVHINQKPYTIKTTFIRVCALEAWSSAGSAYSDWMKKHSNRFKHAYKKEEVGITYDEALERIRQLGPGNARDFATGLLTTGIRISESYVLEAGKVTGKGGKSRKVYGRIEGVMPRSTFSARLRSVGMKPHTLRKLCATRLAAAGATPADLCKIFGWSSIGTAYQYLQSRDDEKLNELMETCFKGS